MFNWFKKMAKTIADRQFESLAAQLHEIDGKLKSVRRIINQQGERGQEIINRLDHFEGQITQLNTRSEMILSMLEKLGSPQQPNSLEVRFVYKVPNNHQDEPYSIAIGGVTDEEGEPLPDTRGLTTEVTSSDDAVVAANFDPATNSGVAHFGKSGVASLNAVVKNAKGDILGSGAADFTVTTGDPAAVSDVKIAFGGLSEEAPAPDNGGGTEPTPTEPNP